jgi:hypothetical protein
MVILTFLLSVVSAAAAQTRTAQKPDPDRLGLSCAQILERSSSDWIAKVTSMDSSIVDGKLRGIRVYGNCYDERTDRLTQSLGKSGKGPLRSARGNFREFEQALKDYTAKALAAADPPADAVKSATATLYEKQFRYDFYRRYETKSSKLAAAPAKNPAEPVPPPIAAQPASQPLQDLEVSEMTKAKNRFGELLDALPDGKLREIHKAFGKIFSGGPVRDEMKLEVYHYAIFCLEPSSAAPFSSPPF